MSLPCFPYKRSHNPCIPERFQYFSKKKSVLSLRYLTSTYLFLKRLCKEVYHELKVYSISLWLCTLFQNAVVGCVSVSQRRHFFSQNIQRWLSDDACFSICFNAIVVPVVKCQWKKSAQKSTFLVFWGFFVLLLLFAALGWKSDSSDAF